MLSEVQRARIIRRLIRDVETTIGSGHDAVIFEAAANIAEITPGIDNEEWYRDHLVDDVQQYFHDAYVDTTWPTCPRHPNHPLWLHGENWRCERDDVAVAVLGELKSTLNRGQAT